MADVFPKTYTLLCWILDVVGLRGVNKPPIATVYYTKGEQQRTFGCCMSDGRALLYIALGAVDGVQISQVILCIRSSTSNVLSAPYKVRYSNP